MTKNLESLQISNRLCRMQSFSECWAVGVTVFWENDRIKLHVINLFVIILYERFCHSCINRGRHVSLSGQKGQIEDFVLGLYCHSNM